MIVYVKLQTKDIFNIESRIEEIQEMKDWIDELVDWDSSKYSFNFRSSGAKIFIWFEEPEHAIMCKLRWA
jgi:hypothetical protein